LDSGIAATSVSAIIVMHHVGAGRYEGSKWIYDPKMRVLPTILTSMAIGAAFGVTTSLVNNVPDILGEVGQSHSEDSAATWTAIFVSLILDSGWAWAAVAFALGWITASRVGPARVAVVAAQAGAVGLIVATVAYYTADLAFGIEVYWPTVGYWLLRAVVFGLPLGVAGALARRPGVVGLLAGLILPLGAAMNMVVFPLRSGLAGESSAAGWAQLSVWVAAITGAALVVLRFVRARRIAPVSVGRPGKNGDGWTARG